MRVAIVLIITTIGIRGAILAQEDSFSKPQLWEYDAIAQHIVAGDGFAYEFLGTTYRSFCEPLYPAICAVNYKLFGASKLPLVLLQLILSALLSVTVWRLSYIFTGNIPSSIIAGAIVAIHPGLIIYSTKLHPLLLDALMFSIVVLTSLRYAKAPSDTRAAVIGLAVGISFLTRPTILAAVPAIAIWNWKATRPCLSVQLRRLLITSGVMVIVGGIWILRNYSVHGEFVLMRSTSAFVFWLGNNAYSSGSARNADDQDIFFDAVPDEFRREAISAKDEMAQHHFFKDAAFEYVRSDPQEFVRRSMKKFVALWWFWPHSGLSYREGWIGSYKLWWLGLCLCGLYATWVVGSSKRSLRASLLYILAFVISIALAQSLYYVEGRHRLALEPVLCSVFAFGAYQIWCRIQLLSCGRASKTREC